MDLVVPSDNQSGNRAEIAGFNGAFTHSIDIELPAQRGLEPNLSLVYDSSQVNRYGKHSQLGAGWRLSGLSDIQRANSRKGLPSFDASDIWLLDGHEMVPCGDYTDGGCGVGATHVTWVDNFQRIKRVTESNTWEITSRDGTKFIYKATGEFGAYDTSDAIATEQATQYRYLLAEKTNTLGQSVTYDYTCGSTTACYIENISYDIGEIRFHWETRTDTVTYAVGRKLAGLVSRLRTIEVRAAGSMLRTYALGYVQSAATGRSLLTSLVERGRDSVIADGVVTAGTALPGHNFEYTGAFPALRSVENGNSVSGSFLSYGRFSSDHKLHSLKLEEGRDGGTSYCRFERSDTDEEYELRPNPASTGPYCDLTNLKIAFFKNNHSSKKEILYKYKYTEDGAAQFGGNFASYAFPDIVGDFDGDGLDDAITIEDNLVTDQYYSSSTIQSWSEVPNKLDGIGDFNGDGLSDVAYFDGTTLKIKLSNGESGFIETHTKSFSWIPTSGPVITAKKYIIVADFNGDEVDDIAIYIGHLPRSNYQNRAQNQGRGLTKRIGFFGLPRTNYSGSNVLKVGLSPSLPLKGLSPRNSVVPVIIDEIDAYYSVYLSTGRDFVEGPQYNLQSAHAYYVDRIGIAAPWGVDIDLDGRADFVSHRSDYHHSGSPFPAMARIYLNRNASIHRFRHSGDNTFDAKVAGIVDENRDGIPEVALSPKQAQSVYAARYSFISEHPDLLQKLREPLGAETTISYEFHDPELQTDLPLRLFVVKSIETYDGRSTRATTDFTYSGAKWNWDERQFLGFEKIVATLPQITEGAGRPTVETIYRQDLPSIGRISSIVHKSGSGALLQKTQEAYVTKSDKKPFRSLNTESESTTYFGGTQRTKRIVREFDTYGLVRKTIQHGDLATTGDEWVHTRSAFPNTDKYIVDRWAIETINAGTAYHDTNNRRWRRWHHYDDANTDVTQAPVRGLKTKMSEWTGGGDEEKIALVVSTFDSNGNLLTKADAFSNTWHKLYDATYQLFPEETRNPLYGSDNRQKKTLVWDAVCGVVTRETNEKGGVTDHSYDNLCRKTQTDLPGGGQITYSYLNWGDPAASFNRVSVLHPNGSGAVHSEMQFDGLGRVYEQRKASGSGGVGNASHRVQKVFDTRGNVEKQSLPFATGDTIIWKEYRYDDLDRQIRVVHPDGQTIQTNYFAGDAFAAFETIDENGNKQILHSDAYGNDVYRDRFDGTTRLRTTYSHDVLGRLVEITDPLGSMWLYSYDGHGNKILASDPDLGCREMVYDAANRLASKVQADGSRIAYVYDALGRLTEKDVEKDALQFPSCATGTPSTNRAPLAVNDNIGTVQAGSAVPVNVLANDSDPDGDTLSVTAINGTAVQAGGQVSAASGTVTLNTDNTVTYRPTTSAIGAQTFSYTLFDGSLSSVGTVTATIDPQSRPPVAADDTATVTIGGSVGIAVLANDNDPDGDSLTVTAIDGIAVQQGDQITTASGVVTLNADETLTFEPTGSATNTRSFSYSISDTVFTDTATVTIEVQPQSTAPVAENESVIVSPGGSIEIDVLANDSDPNGDNLTITHIHGVYMQPGWQTWVSDADGLVIYNQNNTLTYQPSVAASGTKTFSYTISDGTEQAVGTITAIIQVGDNAPVAENENVSVTPGGSIDIDVLANDSDPDGDPLTITHIHGVYMQPGWQTWVSDADGLVIYNQNNTLTYQPSVAATGTKNFSYTISDGSKTAVGTVTAIISTVGTTPVAGDESISVAAGGSIIIDVLANDSDPNGDNLTITQIHGVDMQPGWQTWVSDADGLVIYNQNNTLTYQPSVAATGNKTFTYTISDGSETTIGTITAVITSGATN